MKKLLLSLVVVIGVDLPSAVRADTFYPMVMSISPVAVQAGRTSECEVSARYTLYGAHKVFVTGTGVVGEVDPPAKADPKKPQPEVNKLKVRFKVAADALPGVRDVRIATPRGVSTLGQLVVVRDPVIREAADNDTMAKAQAITLPATVCGAIEKPEDVDYYKFRVAAGTGLTFHVRAQRLENKIHDLQEHADPILTLRGATGTVLASNDNYFFGDPLLYYHFKTAGEYYLEIRDVRYGGNPDWVYSIEINDRPFVTQVYPSRLVPGKATRLLLVGDNLPPDPTATLTLPPDTADGLHWATLRLANGQVTNAAPVIVSRLPEVLENEGDHGTVAKAQPIPVPAGISGQIGAEDEADCYGFEAKAGEHFSFEVVAHAHQSMLDSYLRILNDKGQVMAENDDVIDRFIHADSRIDNWAAPSAGRYIVEVRDVHGRGGPGFVYFLKVTRSEPSFELLLDSDKTLLAPGTAGVIFARVTRRNGFAGAVQLAVGGLPPGVTANCGRILPDREDGCLILKAAANAPRGAVNIRITGSAEEKDGKGKVRKLTAVAVPLQEAYMPGGGRAHWPVEIHTVSVGAPLDIRAVHVTPTAVTLKPGESKKVQITLERAPDFKGGVTLDVLFQHLDTIYGNSLPAGVTIDDKASKTVLAGNESKGYITLKAAADAKPVERQLVPVMAHVSINFVMKFTYCGEQLLVTVSKPAK
jgi:hypothetical protein